MKLSIIDIGTQSFKHYIFEQNGLGKKLVYYKRHSDANLGESNVISRETINRNIQILRKCLDLNKAENVARMHLVGTEILRKAENASDFTAEARKISGHDIEIISHDKEALYLYEGFLDVVPKGEKFGAINIGGGSTELVIGSSDRLMSSVKLPFGAKFIRKTFGEHNDINWQKLDKYLDSEIQVADQVPELFITGVLDFLTTVLPHSPFVSKSCSLLDHPIILTIKDWRDWILKMRATPVEKQKEYYFKDPNFCDGTTIGHSVYYIFAKKLGVERVIPSSRDLTDGIIYEMNQGTKKLFQ
jgi:exopolyphosphatase / guanosine-5'-triphosphate,3'-diphosphate pyrophosphatase